MTAELTPSHRIKWMTEASFQLAHPTTGGIAAMMGGINPMPGSITPMTCCIIPITGIIVLLMADVIVPMMGSRVLTAGGRLPMMGEIIGTGNPAGGTVNVFCMGLDRWCTTTSPEERINSICRSFA
jgi:hypothetical protein